MDVRKVAVIVPVRDDPHGLEVVAAPHRRAGLPGRPDGRLHRGRRRRRCDPGGRGAVGVTPIGISPARGSYFARNVALEQLPDDVEVVAFTDGDCLPAPGWLTGHIAALATADLSGGAIDVTLSARPHPAELVDKARHLQQHAYVTRDNYAATANLAVRRSVVDAMQFDSTLQTGGDVEFGRRATASGRRLVYTPRRARQHPARETTAELMRKITRICGGMSARADYWQRPRDPRRAAAPRHRPSRRAQRHQPQPHLAGRRRPARVALPAAHRPRSGPQRRRRRPRGSTR